MNNGMKLTARWIFKYLSIWVSGCSSVWMIDFKTLNIFVRHAWRPALFKNVRFDLYHQTLFVGLLRGRLLTHCVGFFLYLVVIITWLFRYMFLLYNIDICQPYDGLQSLLIEYKDQEHRTSKKIAVEKQRKEKLPAAIGGRSSDLTLTEHVDSTQRGWVRFPASAHLTFERNFRLPN